MYLYPYKIFALSKNKRLLNREEPWKTLGIYDVCKMDYVSAQKAKEEVTGSCISVLLGEIKKGTYLNVLDLDDCFLEDGSIEPQTRDLLDCFEDYEWEVSTSGTGIHIYVLTSKKYSTFIVKDLSGCKSFEFYADKRHIVTTTFDFKNNNLKLNAHNDLLDSIIEEIEEKKNEELKQNGLKRDIIEQFEGVIDNDESKARGVLLGRKPVTDMFTLRGCGYKDSKLIEIIDTEPDTVDQSAHDCKLIAKLMYYTLSIDSAWDLAKKTNYYQHKDERHKKKFDNPTYRQRTNDYIAKGRY